MKEANQQQKARQRRVLIRRTIASVGLWGFCLLSQPATADGEDVGPCKTTARHVWRSQLFEIQEEYWIAIANASTLPTHAERQEAIATAKEDRKEEKGWAGELREAREELCEKLKEHRYDPVINPDDFLSPEETAADPNPYFPLVPGTKYTYQGETDEGTEVVEVTITDDTREILGVDCMVVEDVVFLEGEKIEDTRDYYAQHKQTGDVWYFGENTFELEDGLIVELAGAWIAGEEGGKPGILTKANASVGDVHRQEMLLGDAEDYAEVLGLSESVTVPAGTFENCRRTFEGTPLEPDALEHKFAAPGVGVILEVNVETGERLELISFEPPTP